MTYAQLTATHQQVAAVAAGIVAQQKHKHIAKGAKQERDVALQALNHWMQDFRAVARIALADQP